MKKSHLQLSETERQQIEQLTKQGSLPARKFKRLMALLELDRGRTFTAVAQTVGATIQSVSTWAKKYREQGLAGLDDKPIPGRPITISGEERAKVTALACSDAPEGHSQWSLRLLADKAVELELVDEISHTHVGRILKKTNSSPT
ncbi:MAG: helix-turn-helix domain-containing protein [Ardenticatenaceae bacterium]|nr:helix-turn-helix domain-containing protein [Ardenticatenaceae bacterium]